MDARNLLEVEPLVDIKVIKETLQRIGVANRRKKVLYPSCYLYELDDKVYLVHFKQLFILTKENSYDNIADDDILRRNAIAFCLRQWKLIDVDMDLIDPYNKFVFVLNHKDKDDWYINHKFNYHIIEQNINT